MSLTDYMIFITNKLVHRMKILAQKEITFLNNIMTKILIQDYYWMQFFKDNSILAFPLYDIVDVMR